MRCEVCDKGFEKKNKNHKYCSRKCYDKKKYHKYRDKIKSRSLEYYYKNSDKVLKYQKRRIKQKLREDKEFKKLRKFRDESRYAHNGMKKIDEPCSVCGTHKDLQRHHPSYESRTVVVLCRQCHNKAHNP